MNALFNKVGEYLAGHPGGAELDAYVHGLNFGRHGCGECLHIGAVLRVFLCRRLRNVQFSPHIAGEVFVADFPFCAGRIAKNQSFLLQFFLNGRGRPPQKLIHAGKVHLARLTQGDDQGILGAFGPFRNLRGLEHPLPENGRFSRRSRAGLPSLTLGQVFGQSFVVLHFQRFQQGMFRIVVHQRTVGL